jgi:hypothetical protein
MEVLIKIEPENKISLVCLTYGYDNTDKNYYVNKFCEFNNIERNDMNSIKEGLYCKEVEEGKYAVFNQNTELNRDVKFFLLFIKKDISSPFHQY